MAAAGFFLRRWMQPRGDHEGGGCFLRVLGGTAAWPVVARAQELGRVYRLGFLLPTLRDSPAIAAFFDELRLNGFVEGRNLEMLPGGFGVARNQIEAMVAPIVKASPDVIAQWSGTLHSCFPGGDTNHTDRRHERRYGRGRAGGVALAAGS